MKCMISIMQAHILLIGVTRNKGFENSYYLPTLETEDIGDPWVGLLKA